MTGQLRSITKNIPRCCDKEDVFSDPALTETANSMLASLLLTAEN